MNKLEEIENAMPETPRFEGYFRSMANGQHPMKDQKYRFDDEKEQMEQ